MNDDVSTDTSNTDTARTTPINDPRWPTRITVACSNFATAPRDKQASVDKLIAVTRQAAA